MSSGADPLRFPHRFASAHRAWFVLTEAVRWFVGERELFRVRGGSMMPTLADGDLVLADNRVSELPPPGAIVVAREPDAVRILVKRVRSTGTATVALGSDDPTQGRDSRHFGSVPLRNVMGTVTLSWRSTR